jgi:hypothetical protein
MSIIVMLCAGHMVFVDPSGGGGGLTFGDKLVKLTKGWREYTFDQTQDHQRLSGTLDLAARRLVVNQEIENTVEPGKSGPHTTTAIDCKERKSPPISGAVRFLPGDG